MSVSGKACRSDQKPCRKMGKPFGQRFVTGAAWLSAIALWLCAASVFVSPARFRLLGVVGLAFPFLLAGVLFMLILTLLLAPRRSWIPLLGLLGCVGSIRSYCPLNFSSEPPSEALTVLSYNVENFCNAQPSEADGNPISSYVERLRPDIFCFQEGAMAPTRFDGEVRDRLHPLLPHFDSLNAAGNVIGCFSRYPIVGKEEICRHKSNGAVAFKLLYAGGDTLIVVNCHLESMHLSQEDRDRYHEMVKRRDLRDSEGSPHRILSKIARSSVERARQADSIAAFLQRNKGRSVILCGDFNDTPISYTHHRIASQLTDAYTASGNGLGRSFNRDAIIVRIDNMMCSDDWRPYACTIDRSISCSDHYPIRACFVRRR